MEADPVLRRFREERARFYDGLEEHRRKVDEMLASFEKEMPSAADAARLEGLRLERARLFVEFQAATDRFVAHVLDISRRRGGPPR